MTRKELEQARERIDGLNEVFECDGNLEDSEAMGVALKLLIDAELDRERNEQKTCDGCAYEPEGNVKVRSGRCYVCCRYNLVDRYEPKGEPPCTQD